MKPNKIFLPVLALFILVATALAAAPEWKPDGAHTGIYFDVKHIFATVRGHFEDFSAEIRFDPQDLAGSSCSFSVQTKSINTRIRKRDTHLRSEELFAVGKYPLMTFTSSKIVPDGDNRYQVTGDLTVKDVTRTVSVPFVFHGTTSNPFDAKQTVAGFDARFFINRLEYHVGDGKFYRLGVIDRTVDIFISVEVLQ